MSVLFRCRVDPARLSGAEKVTEKFGTSVGEAFRMFLAQIERTGTLPLSFSGTEQDLVDTARRNRIWSELDATESW